MPPGIGRATAQHLLNQGFQLAVIGRNADLLEEWKAQGFGSPSRCGDASVDQAVKMVLEHYGRIDAVVNNAGITRTTSCA